MNASREQPTNEIHMESARVVRRRQRRGEGPAGAATRHACVCVCVCAAASHQGRECGQHSAKGFAFVRRLARPSVWGGRGSTAHRVATCAPAACARFIGRRGGRERRCTMETWRGRGAEATHGSPLRAVRAAAGGSVARGAAGVSTTRGAALGVRSCSARARSSRSIKTYID